MSQTMFASLIMNPADASSSPAVLQGADTPHIEAHEHNIGPVEIELRMGQMKLLGVLLYVMR
jgi:hypothetical protein